jgi:hypothetical protein
VSEQVITFRFPKKYIAPEDTESYEEIVLPWVEGKSLKLYYRDTRFDTHLQTKNLRHTVRKQVTREPVRTSYVPQPGEIFFFIPAGSLS